MTNTESSTARTDGNDTSKCPLLMGILNVTPDSFYDGGKYDNVTDALERARSMVRAGADVIDVGGESTRPGAKEVPASEEKKRVIPVIESLESNLDTRISVDTSKSSVAEEAMKAGADWINDIYAFRNDEAMARVARDHNARVVLMHMQGTPQTMQDNPEYDDVVKDILKFLKQRAEFAISNGIDRENIILDPGIGFGKTLEHNRRILRNIDEFLSLEFPLLVGHSRKSFLGEVLEKGTDERLFGTLSISSYLVNRGVEVLRIHDIAPHSDCRKIMNWLSHRESND